MPRISLPLLERVLQATGDVLLRAEVGLLLRDSLSVWKAQIFRIDSGTEMTTMPAALARQLDLPMPARPVRGVTHAPTGLEVRAGVLRAQVIGTDQTEYVFPCYFVGDPDTPPGPGQPPTLAMNLLGLTGVVDKLRILFDGTPTPAAPYGSVVVEKV